VTFLTGASILIGVAATVWYESPLVCSPTMGCPNRSTAACGCGFLGGFAMDSSCNK
jgi:hypothetical protein